MDTGIDHIIGVRAKDLVLGADYQRELREDHAINIADKFDVRKALVVVVSKRANGEMFVIDGQHRVVAAVLSDEDKILPCIIYEGLTVQEESLLFTELQRERKSLTQHDLFWADVISEDAEAIDIKRIVEEVGFKLSRKDYRADPYLNCYAAVRKLYRSNAGGSLRETLTAMANAWGTDKAPKTAAVGAVGAFVVQYRGEYSPERLSSVLGKFTQDQFIVGTRRFKEAVGSGYAGATSGGRYVQSIYNKGKRTGLMQEWVPGRHSAVERRLGNDAEPKG